MFSTLRRVQCRRLDDFELRKWLRQLSIPRRVSLTAILVLFLLYFIISSLTSSPYVSESQKCLNERLNAWKIFENENLVVISNKQFGFTGNGLVLFFTDSYFSDFLNVLTAHLLLILLPWSA